MSTTLYRWGGGVPVNGTFDTEPTSLPGSTLVYGRDAGGLPYLVRTGTGNAIIGKTPIGPAGGLTAHSGRLYFRLDSMPGSGSQQLVAPLDPAGATPYRIVVTGAGAWRVHDANNAQKGFGGVTLTAPTWYRLEWQATPTTLTARLHLGDSLTVHDTITTTAQTYGQPSNFRVGQILSTPLWPLRFAGVRLTDALEWIGPATTPPAVTATRDRVLIVGDSLTAMNGLNGQPIYDALNARGYPMSNVFHYAVGGKFTLDPDIAGRPTTTSITDAVAVLGGIDHAVIALGTNDTPKTDAAITSAVNSVLQALASAGVPRVTWIGLTYETKATATATRVNPLIKAAVEASTIATKRFIDPDPLVHDGRDETGWWVGDGTHMTPLGYNTARAPIFADAIAPIVATPSPYNPKPPTAPGNLREVSDTATTSMLTWDPALYASSYELRGPGAPITVASPNLVTNSALADASTWSASGVSTAVSVEQVDGAQALRMSKSADATNLGVSSTGLSPQPGPGAVLALSFQVRIPVGSPVTTVTLMLRDDGANDSAASEAAPSELNFAVTPGEWTDIGVVTRMKAGRTLTRIYALLAGSFTAGAYWHMRAPRLSVGPLQSVTEQGTYTVRGISPTAVAGPDSNVVTAQFAPPATPVLSQLDATQTTATLGWSASADAASYELVRSGVITPVSGTSTTVSAEGAYTVRAVGTNGMRSGDSNVVTAQFAAPAAPVVTATAAVDSAELSWPAVTGATSYEVLRDGALVAMRDTTTATVAAEGTYTVVAISAAGYRSAPSSPVTVELAPPAAPTNLTATPSVTDAVLSWDAVAGAADYEVYRDGEQVAAPTEPSFVATAEGVYTVAATSAAGHLSEPSDPVTVTFAAPSAPTNLRTTEVTPTTAVLAWDPVPGATSYTLTGPSGPVVTTEPTATVDTEGTYTVTATSGAGHESAPSAAVTVTFAAVASPADVQVSSTVTAATLTWGAIADAVAYRVHLAGELVGEVGAPEYVASAEGSYTVTAVSAAGRESAPSAAVSVTFAAPPAPTGLQVTATATTSATLAWDPVADVTTYTLDRGGEQVITADTSTTVDAEGTYTVTATSAAGHTSAPSEPVTVTFAAPSAPVNLRTTADIDSATLAWDPVADAVTYRVYLDALPIGEVTAPEFAATDEGTYVVTAVTAAGHESPPSAPAAVAFAPPRTPTLRLIAVTTDSADLAWDPVDGAVSYVLTLAGAEVSNSPDTVATVTAEGSYAVAAVSAAGRESIASLPVTVEFTVPPPPEPPAAPGGLRQTSTTATAAVLAWDAVADAVSYQVYYNGAPTLTTTTTLTTITAEGSYTITATNAAGLESEPSAVLVVAFADPTPTEPVPLRERAQARAWIDAINLALGTDATHDYDVDPDDLPPIHVLISVTLRAGSPLRMCGGRPMLGWRLTTRVVGRTVDEARWARERVQQYADRRLPALESTPLRLESEDVIALDDGMFSGLTVWTYGAPNRAARITA